MKHGVGSGKFILACLYLSVLCFRNHSGVQAGTERPDKHVRTSRQFGSPAGEKEFKTCISRRVIKIRGGVLLSQWSSNISVHQNPQADLLEHRLMGSSPRVSDLVGLEWAPQCCISNKFPDNSDAAGPGATVSEPLH